MADRDSIIQEIIDMIEPPELDKNGKLRSAGSRTETVSDFNANNSLHGLAMWRSPAYHVSPTILKSGFRAVAVSNPRLLQASSMK